MKKFLHSLIDENPIFVLCLGLCPALAVTTTFENGYLMGLCLLFILLLSNVIVSLVSKVVEEHIRVPAYIMIIATFVTILELILNTYIEPLSKVLGIYIPLIVVNCIVLGRALSYASNHSLLDSVRDAFKIGLSYALSLSLIGLIREVLGNNTITIMDKISNLTGYVMKYSIFPDNDVIPNRIFTSPAGAFLTIGFY